jgi:hypothetical protein
MAQTTETRWFVIAVIITVLFIIGFSSANIYYFNRIKSGKTISKSDLNSSVTFNVILLVLSLMILVWAIWKSVFSQKYRSDSINKVRNYVKKPFDGDVGNYMHQRIVQGNHPMSPFTQQSGSYVPPTPTPVPVNNQPHIALSPKVEPQNLMNKPQTLTFQPNTLTPPKSATQSATQSGTKRLSSSNN